MALVGHSGSEKTTCANLLLRFWDPDAGAVLVDGTDARIWPVETLRDLVSLVPQDVYSFNTSVQDNIRLSQSDATDADIDAAAERALVAEFVPDLPEGLDTVIGERGTMLSTIRTADLIVVLDNGHVAETGTYHELISQPGTLARLVAAQRDGHLER